MSRFVNHVHYEIFYCLFLIKFIRFILQGKELEELIAKGIDIGCRLFDTAFIYNNEDQIGRALDQKLKEGAINREDLFIVSKVRISLHGFVGNVCCGHTINTAHTKSS